MASSMMKMFNLLLLLYILLFVNVISILGDTPANCTYDDIVGMWTFYEGERGQTSKLDCILFPGHDNDLVKHQFRVELLFPNVAVDEKGNQGTWTLIYNQGFEVQVNYRKYFTFSNWTQAEHTVSSRCFETKIGWAHDVFIRDWSCFVGRRTDPSMPQEVKQYRNYLADSMAYENSYFVYKNNLKLIEKINRHQKSWRAKIYPAFENMKRYDIVKMAGGIKSAVSNRPKPSPVSQEQTYLVKALPLNFDWRDLNGINYVSPVRSQGRCGSCYAFASMAMLEARYRIRSNNTLQPIFSPQDIVECSEYSQGCDGGFPYLIAGKHGQDFGVVEETCNPYTGAGKQQCTTKIDCKRYYTAEYGYIGGYYGATNEALMRLELVKNGPFAVGIEVYEDFFNYASGIYHHVFKNSRMIYSFKWNPFQLTNHAVLIVGYGVDPETREKYWTVKNSWGQEWGEEGYFRIRRATDECGIESLAITATPIITY